MSRRQVDCWPTANVVRDIFVLVCGLIARERVSIDTKLEDLTLDEKKELCNVLKEKLEYPANLSAANRNKAIKSAMKQIASLQPQFKSHLRADLVRQDELPFEKHPFLKPEDWEEFVETTNSPFFLACEPRYKR